MFIYNTIRTSKPSVSATSSFVTEFRDSAQRKRGPSREKKSLPSMTTSIPALMSHLNIFKYLLKSKADTLYKNKQTEKVNRFPFIFQRNVNKS